MVSKIFGISNFEVRNKFEKCSLIKTTLGVIECRKVLTPQSSCNNELLSWGFIGCSHSEKSVGQDPKTPRAVCASVLRKKCVRLGAKRQTKVCVFGFASNLGQAPNTVLASSRRTTDFIHIYLCIHISIYIIVSSFSPFFCRQSAGPPEFEKTLHQFSVCP